ncbi:hypothetical protein [Noviherbaspirillum malthae]|jgi:hypothetical protein|uniref:hypothetical protein n=1 Tax=Noviherbaspirillum malthae TaxID=1260987 RepID=UPI00188EA0CC|nr:hypothetical protein [Noviherbaspirillum malthae]
MNIQQDKQQERQHQGHQVAQPAEESLKKHGDQLEKPLHDALVPDSRNGQADRTSDGSGGQQ